LYLQDHSPEEKLAHFHKAIIKKMQLLQDQPEIGFKSKKHSKFRRTLIAGQYVLIYTAGNERIIINRLKHKKRE